MKTTKILLSSVLIMVTVLIVSCYKNKSSYNSSNTTNSKVSIMSSGFSPASLTVVTGSTVTWTNNDNVAHSVTTADGSINSGDIAPESSYTKTFGTTGTFSYYDGHNTSMTGVIVVAASSGGGY